MNARSLALALAGALVVAGCRGAADMTSAPSGSNALTAPAPTCRAPAQVTVAVTEGPFFKAGSPERASLVEAGMAGTPLVVSGFVLSRSCRPIAGALLDFWQADAKGGYDNVGFRLRGHQLTDAQGRYRLETILPGEYPGRTPHIHVKVRPPGGAVLTTQLYLPDQPRNASDSFFAPSNVVQVEQRSTTGWTARFDFVVDAP